MSSPAFVEQLVTLTTASSSAPAIAAACARNLLDHGPSA
jgi:hypothetical protein